MRFAKDFRRIAWQALEAPYWMAVLVTLVAVLLGAGSSGLFLGTGSSASYHFTGAEGAKDTAHSFLQRPAGAALFLALVVGVTVVSIFCLAQFVVGGAIDIGLCRYNLGVIDRKNPPFSTLFSGFGIFGKALGLRCWMLLFTFLWTLLFLFPGVIAKYRYAMAPYIMAEDPSIDVREAVRVSKKMMHGNKWRLFCLNFSFIGWYILAALSAGVGFVFLAPYINAARTAFYLEVSGQNYRLAGYAAN